MLSQVTRNFSETAFTEESSRSMKYSDFTTKKALFKTQGMAHL